jgi:hypothetical protein
VHAFLPGGAARNRREQAFAALLSESFETGRIEIGIVAMDDGQHPRGAAGVQQRAQRVGQQRLAGQGEILLRDRRADARAAPGGDHENDRGVRLRHGQRASRMNDPRLFRRFQGKVKSRMSILLRCLFQK